MTRLARTFLRVLVAAVVLVSAMRILGSYILSNRVHANETSVAVGLRTLARTAHRYNEQHHEYPASLEQLATADEDHLHGYALDPVFKGKKSEYYIEYVAPISSQGKHEAYFVRAVPYGSNMGAFEFCMDETETIRFTAKGTHCTRTSAVLGAEHDKPIIPYVYRF